MGRVRFHAGEVLSAAKLNDWREGIAAYPGPPSLSPSGGLGRALEISGPATRLERRRLPFLARLTSGSSPYSWVSRDETACGTFADGPRSGTSSAYEVNAISGLSGKSVRLYPDRHGKYRFQWVAGAAGTPGVTINGCDCDPIPSTIEMTSADPTCNFGVLQSATLVYGPTPSVFAPLSLGANCFLSTDTFTSDYSEEEFYYLLTCNDTFFSISRLFPVSIFGSPFREPPIYSWFIADSPNTCSPFSMTNGSIFAGGDPACDVDLSE